MPVLPGIGRNSARSQIVLTTLLNLCRVSDVLYIRQVAQSARRQLRRNQIVSGYEEDFQSGFSID
jgi:hypothetical protein